MIVGPTALVIEDKIPLPTFLGLSRFFFAPRPDIPINPYASPIMSSPSISGVCLSTCELDLSANFWIPDLA
jgi:hypothetical protein